MMINILKRSSLSSRQLLNTANKPTLLNSYRYYSSNKNNNGFDSLKDFTEQFKEPKPFDYSKPIDFGFISKELNIPISDKGIPVNKDVVDKLGVHQFDISNEDNRKGLQQLERLLRTPEGKAYLNLLLADIKQSFNLESDEQMKLKSKHLSEEMTLKLGANKDIEQFIKENPDLSKLTDQQRDVVSEYYSRNPYVKHIRQTALIMDLVDLVEVYNKSDSKTFDAAFEEKFQVGKNPAPKSREAEKELRDQQNTTQEEIDSDEQFASSTEDQRAQDNILRLIKSDQLPAYLDQLFLSAQQTLVPKSTEALQEEATRDSIEEMIKLEEEEDEPLFPDADLLQPVELQQQAKDPRTFLKYYNIYPAKIRKWIDYTHTPLGFYTNLGVWYNFPEWYSSMYPSMKPEQMVTKESVSSKFEEKELPEDLRDVYRFGVTKEEADILHPKLRDFLSFRNASQGEINSYRRQVCISKFGNDKGDTGSTSVQIAIFTERINYLEAHITKNKKDNLAKRRLMLLQSKRKSMINYLKRKDVEEYFRVTKDLKIRNSSI